MADLRSYTHVLRRYDRDLYAGRNMHGLPCVFRRSKRFVPVFESEAGRLSTLIDDIQFVFAITDNWMASGKPRDWGIDDILHKIQSIDALANQKLFDEMDEANERIDQVKRKDLRNEMEGFWSYERRRFAKTFDDVLTHSMSHDEPRKRIKDRSIKCR
jgi:hypothetical protein